MIKRVQFQKFFTREMFTQAQSVMAVMNIKYVLEVDYDEATMRAKGFIMIFMVVIVMVIIKTSMYWVPTIVIHREEI